MEEKIGFTVFAIIIGLVLSFFYQVSVPVALGLSVGALAFFWTLFFVFFGG